MHKKIFLSLFALASFLICIKTGFSVEAIQIPGADVIKDVSIGFDAQGKNVSETARIASFKLLNFASMLVAGFALIYVVLIGAYMIVYSDSEDVIKKQKKQIMYVALGFIFLNIPTIVYELFLNPNAGAVSANMQFWNDWKARDFFEGIGELLRVLVFVVAAIMFTWSAFTLIGSRGKDEYKKTALNRFIYGSAALIFMGIVEIWTKIFTSENIQSTLHEYAGWLFSLAFYFIGPVAIFFLMLGAYYYITSAGDEERTKKGKAIIFNTMIASVILLASFSFIKELSTFLK